MEVRQIDFNPTFITRMIPRIDWSVLKAAAEAVSMPRKASIATVHLSIYGCVFQLGHGQGLPESLPEDYESQDDFLKSAHHVLMEVYNTPLHYLLL